MVIRYLRNCEIDKIKWDECILKSLNSIIYVRSFYLDNCTSNKWDAIVLNDYEFLMPIIYKKKYGITYLYQPPFLQQTGVFSAKKIDDNILHLFLSELENRFKFAEINLNYANQMLHRNKIKFTERNNFILPLFNSYEDISINFKPDFLRNLKQAAKLLFVYEKETSVDLLVDLYVKLYGHRVPSVKVNDYDALKLNCKTLLANNDAVLRKVTYNGNILASIILLKDKKRLYNIANSVTAEGKKISANHFLIKNVIKEFCGGNMVLDLEGSDVKGISSFYQSMNPLNEKYVSIKFNNLPKIVRFFKK